MKLFCNGCLSFTLIQEKKDEVCKSYYSIILDRLVLDGLVELRNTINESDLLYLSSAY